MCKLSREETSEKGTVTRPDGASCERFEPASLSRNICRGQVGTLQACSGSKGSNVEAFWRDWKAMFGICGGSLSVAVVGLQCMLGLKGF